MNTATIAVIGTMNKDVICNVDQMPKRGGAKPVEWTYRNGGRGVSAAVSAHRLSHYQTREGQKSAFDDLEIHVQLTGRVGGDLAGNADEHGRSLTMTVEENGLNTDTIQVAPGRPTGTTTIIAETDHGDARYFYDAGANLSLLPNMFSRVDKLAGGKTPDLIITQLGLPIETITEILSTATRAKIPVLWRPAPCEDVFDLTLYRMVKHLIVNKLEAAWLSGWIKPLKDFRNEADYTHAMDEFLEEGVENVVILLGEEGARYANKSGVYGRVMPNDEFYVSDRTGAGGTFMGAFAVEYVRHVQSGQDFDGDALHRAVQFALDASARTITQVGCLDGIPWRDQFL